MHVYNNGEKNQIKINFFYNKFEININDLKCHLIKMQFLMIYSIITW